MTSPDQNMKIVGSLEVFTPQNATTDRGQIKFTGDFGADYGKLKAIGFGGFGNLMLDCANLQQGLVVRTAANQDGGTNAGGPYAPYSLKVMQSNGLAGSGCVTPSMYVDGSDFTFGPKDGATLFQVKRQDTTKVFDLTRKWSCISAFTQNSWRAGESVSVNIGFQQTFGCGGIGYYAPTGDGSNSGNRLFLGMYDSSASEVKQALLITPTQNVEIPLQLTAGTIYATTYLNLPPPTSSMLLPITLDQLNNRVGVNNVSPAHSLDVMGNINTDTSITSPNVNGLVLKGANDNVNIGTGAGTALSTGSIAIGLNSGSTNQGDYSIALGANAGTLNQHANSIVINATSTALETTNASQLIVKPIRDAAGSRMLSYNTTTGEVSHTAIPTPNLAPITLDQVNNRVGINQATPTTALDVVGTITSNQQIMAPGVNLVPIKGTANNNILIGSHTSPFIFANQTIGIGLSAGNSGQALNCIAIGTNAGEFFQNQDAIGIGNQSGYNAQGFYTVALGTNCGNANQGDYSVAAGFDAAKTSQGKFCVALGVNCGRTSQGQESVAMGSSAGYSGQATQSVAIGASAGKTSQGAHSIAIGTSAADSNQLTESIALGYFAGYSGQGSRSVAIGAQAGQTNQHNNTIVLNATNAALNTNQTNQLMIAPIRNAAGPNILNYNPANGEVTYASPTQTTVVSAVTSLGTTPTTMATLTGLAAGLYYVQCNFDVAASSNLRDITAILYLNAGVKAKIQRHATHPAAENLIDTFSTMVVAAAGDSVTFTAYMDDVPASTVNSASLVVTKI